MKADTVALGVDDDGNVAHVIGELCRRECDVESLDSGPIEDCFEGGVAVEINEGAFGGGFVSRVGDERAADSAWFVGEYGHILGPKVFLLEWSVEEVGVAVDGAIEIEDRDLEPGEPVRPGLCVFHEDILREGY